MDDEGVNKVIDDFIYNIRYGKLLEQDAKRKRTFWKIAGYEDKGRHMERHYQPFQSVQELVILVTEFDKVSDYYQRDQKRLIIIK